MASEGQDKPARTYQGYTIKLNGESGRFEIFWREKKQTVNFAREVEAEDWIDDLVPSHRF